MAKPCPDAWVSMMIQEARTASEYVGKFTPGLEFASDDGLQRDWLAVFTAPLAEQSVVRHLSAYHVESFLPTFEITRVWKNRQKKRIAKPLFPSYVFVHVTRQERRRVYLSPNVLRIVGGTHGPTSIPAVQIETLRTVASRHALEPFPEITLGTPVRVRSGPMQGIEGTLVRKKNSLKFVLSIGLINQHAALEIGADEVEVVGC